MNMIYERSLFVIHSSVCYPCYIFVFINCITTAMDRKILYIVLTKPTFMGSGAFKTTSRFRKSGYLRLHFLSTYRYLEFDEVNRLRYHFRMVIQHLFECLFKTDFERITLQLAQM
jgi:hypothetical protein